MLWARQSPDAVRSLTDDVHLDADPVWSLDGSEVLFTSERAGLPQVFSYDLETVRTVQLTEAPTSAREPGRQLANRVPSCRG